MRKKRHTPEQIIAKLREAEVALTQGAKVPEVYPEGSVLGKLLGPVR